MDRFPLDLTRTSWVRYRDTFGASRAGGRRQHAGQDIAAPVGTPVLAPVAGRIAHAMDRDERACGFGVVLDGTDGARWTLCHFNAMPLVETGERVAAGDVLGVVGASGNATTVRNGVRHAHPHLHISRAHLTPTDRVMGEPENIYRDLLDAQARDMGHAPIERTPPSRERRADRAARARGVDGSVFGGFAVLAAVYWFSRRKKKAS